ncbi:MAG TPA: hypothetical protein VGP24_01685 [Glaciihabitans sp.]|jgi:hypothetical protein|nr:hypothetical protein [Glaciihabitans sp.]
MSTFKHPVGPQPSKVYWRRRLIVGLVLIAIIVVIVLLFNRPDSSTPASVPAPTPTVSEPETPVASGGECVPGDVVVTPVTDATTYAADVSPQLSMTVTYEGAAACTMDVGTDVQEYIITSGEERIWSSKDCQSAPVALQSELTPGAAPLASAPFAWDRTRSDPATCDAETRTAVTGGGASYHLDVIVDGVESSESKQFVLN